MYVTAIVLAAGRGLRLSRPNSFTVRGGIPTHISKMIESGKSRIHKPLVEINSKPIIVYCLGTLSKHPGIHDIILVVNSENLEDIISRVRQYRIKKIKNVVLGGRLRQDSVRNGLKEINRCTDFVLIHDGVRPFIDKDTISSLIQAAEKSGAAIVGVPVKATIKMVTLQASHLRRQITVKKTLKRDSLWEIQTPQVFRRDLILEAYKKFGDLAVTDDSMLVEKLGVRVRVVKGSYDNIKITTTEDLVVAEAILKNQK